MSRPSCLRVSAFLLFFIALIGSFGLAYAQTGVTTGGPGTGGFTGIPDPSAVYTLAGQGNENVKLLVNGGLVKVSGNKCPFNVLNNGGAKNYLGQPMPSGSVAYQAAKKAATGVDPDNCPYMVNDVTGDKRSLFQCQAFYNKKNKTLDGSSSPHIKCCYYEPGRDRDACLLREYDIVNTSQMAQGELATQTGTVMGKQGVQTQEQIDAINAKVEEEYQAERMCFEGTGKRIVEYWANKREIACIRDAKDMISDAIKAIISKFARDTTKTASGKAVSVAVGSSPGAIIPVPDPMAGIGLNFDILSSVAQNVSNLLDKAQQLSSMLNKCGVNVAGLQQLEQWRSKTLNGLCQQVESIVERQLTQCIRVDLSANLTLPQFTIAMQCPINVNLSARLDAGGFNCFNNATIGTGVTGNFGSLYGNTSGGLESLFDGNCFGGGSTTTAGGSSSGTFGAGSALGTGTRVPGIDCGPVPTRDQLTASNSVRLTNLKGTQYLAAGQTTNGWAVGGSETLGGQQITRCDFYQTNRLMRTTYVYGNGASCTSSFLENSFETNTSCYPGGYTPLSIPNIPDACMYNTACLNANHEFDPTLASTGNCAAADPLVTSTGGGRGSTFFFRPSNPYYTYTSGGVGGGAQLKADCSDFTGVQGQPVMCCDPQKQDCSTKAPNVPYCQCDQGDGLNYFVANPTATNPSCPQGGEKTCCSPRLNGGVQGCGAIQLAMQDPTKTVNPITMEMCASELNQCVNPNTLAQTTGADGVPREISVSQLAASKPSPYAYLFVRPNGAVQGQQCCTTEWCNICPQHYVNGYGLALMRAAISTTNPQVGDYNMSRYDSINNAVLGSGWPFIAISEDAGVTYASGLTDRRYITIVRTYEPKIGADSDSDFRIDHPTLFLAESMMNKPDPASRAICNSISSWKYADSTRETFGNSTADMAYVYNKAYGPGKEDEWIQMGEVPPMQETPLAYLNRIRQSYNQDAASPLPPIELCSAVAKICYPGTAAALNGGVAAPNGSGTTPVTPGSTATPGTVLINTSGTIQGTGGSTTTPPVTPVPTTGGGVTPAPTPEPAPTTGGRATQGATQSATPTPTPAPAPASTGGSQGVQGVQGSGGGGLY